MRKAVLHAFLFAIAFAAIWLLLSRLDYVNYFELETISRTQEAKLGEMILDLMKQEHPETTSDTLKSTVERIVHRVGGELGEKELQVTILENKNVNALALPGDNIILYTGLINESRSAEEIAGVIAHEIGHIEYDHVSRKLVRELGLALVLSSAGSESSLGTIREIVRVLSSTAFDREQEYEADAFAVHCMAEANIDPQHLSDFLTRIARRGSRTNLYVELMSTHPDAKNRSLRILDQRRSESFQPSPIFKKDWKLLKSSL